MTHRGQRHQFLAPDAATLTEQMRPHLTDVPAAVVNTLARLAVDYQGRVELPGLSLTVRHTSTLGKPEPSQPPTRKADPIPAAPAAVQHSTPTLASTDTEPQP